MPTLFHSSMGGHRIIVNTQQENDMTLKMNILVCKNYAADFDGDAMNIIFNTSAVARVECMEVSSVKRWFISY
jgi:DNA-directed RNA polymerase beta' subunit